MEEKSAAVRISSDHQLQEHDMIDLKDSLSSLGFEEYTTMLCLSLHRLYPITLLKMPPIFSRLIG